MAYPCQPLSCHHSSYNPLVVRRALCACSNELATGDLGRGGGPNEATGPRQRPSVAAAVPTRGHRLTPDDALASAPFPIGVNNLRCGTIDVHVGAVT